MTTETTKQPDYEKQAVDFLTKHGIKFRATLADSKPAPWRDEGAVHGSSGHHYRVTLSKGERGQGVKFGQRVTFDFWGSHADFTAGVREVTPYDVLACISGDTHCAETFSDFCADYGEDEDSIKALQTFRRCSAFAKRLRAFFTPEEIENLQEIN